MRFSTVADDTLKEVSVAIYDQGNGQFGNDTIYIKIYADNLGLPGTLLDTKAVAPGAYPAFPGRLTVTYVAGPVLYADFHVGVSTSALQPFLWESILSDNKLLGNDRSSYKQSGVWEPFSPGNQDDPNFDIAVVTCRTAGPFTGSIIGKKFYDENRNGVEDPGEPGLQNFKIEARKEGVPGVYDTKFTDIDGIYLFENLPYGNYYISEDLSSLPGWTQTAPSSVGGFVEVREDQGYFGPDFGNDSASCLFPYFVDFDSCLNGTQDGFAGPEPASPTGTLLLHMYGVSTGALTAFDAIADKKCFGHTLRCWDSTCMVISATLTMHIRATAASCESDVFQLGDFIAGGPGVIWSIPVRELIPFSVGTPQDGSWNLNDDMTFVLDLANLPATAGAIGPRNILAAMHDGNLDVLLYDDTMVDYILLEVIRCCSNPCEQDTLFINSGFNQLKELVLAPGTVDAEWKVTKEYGAAVSPPRAAFVVQNDPAWNAAQPQSQWLTSFIKTGDPTLPSPASWPGEYDFEYEFCLDSGFTNPRLAIEMISDNAASVLLNGHSIGSTAWNSYSQPPVAIVTFNAANFKVGRNRLVIKVDNTEPADSPVGIDLVGWVTADGFSVGQDSCCCKCGDANGDGNVSIADAVYMIQYIFGGGPAPCLGAGDVNCDGTVSIADVVYIINYIFGSGPAPCANCK